MRGYPTGSQVIIGSLPSGPPLGPRPGFAASYLAWAQGVIGQGVLPRLPMPPPPVRTVIHTPEKSWASNGKLGLDEGTFVRAGLRSCLPPWAWACALTAKQKATIAATAIIVLAR